MFDEANTPGDITFSFGPFVFIPTQQLLLEGTIPVRLGGRALSILNAFVERPGELLSKTDLIARVWPDTIVEDSSLKVHIAALRKALGEGKHGHRYVANVTGRGYRFVVPVHQYPTRESPLAPCAAAPLLHNLPASHVNPIGRADTVQLLLKQLRHSRFVTIVGSGGIGKTTVALAVAQALLGKFENGIWFVDIGALRDPKAVAIALSMALGLTLHSADPLPALNSFLRDKQTLIILDSCEHLIEAAASLAEHLLQASPGLVLLTTSRELLRVQGELLHHLPPLRTPATCTEMTADQALTYSAVQLFVTRAQSNLESFELTDSNTSLVIGICRKLDGIALAIELTSTRVGTFSLTQLRDVLDDRFQLLHQGHRSVLLRHRSLACALEWSHETLSVHECMILRRLSLFSSSFTLSAVQAIAELDAASVIEGIDGLVSKSLLSADVSGTTVQYRLLDTTRSFALQKLEESGELPLWRLKHAQYCRYLFTCAESEWAARCTTEWINEYRLCLGDVRDALNWAFSPEGDVAIGISLTVAVLPLWMHQSMLAELSECVMRALKFKEAGHPVVDRDLMKLYSALGATMMYTRGLEPEIDAAWTKTLEIAQRLADSEFQLRALWGLAAYHIYIGSYYEGLELLEQFRVIAIQRDDAAAQLDCDRLVATALHYLGEQDLARKHLDHLITNYVSPTHRLRVARFQLDQHVASRVLLSNIQWLQGHPDQAVLTAQNALTDALSTDHALSICNALVLSHCPIALYVGNLSAAQQSLTMLTEHQARFSLVLWSDLTQCLQGTLSVMLGQRSGLEVLREGVEALRSSHFGMRYPFFLSVLAAGYGAQGNLSAAHRTIGQALEWSLQHEEYWSIAETLRIKADLSAMEGTTAAFAAAEKYYLQSFDWARRQRALSWELRTATSLALLWQNSRTEGKAEGLLTSVYARFEEGFETTDLQTAQSLIHRLRGSKQAGDFAEDGFNARRLPSLFKTHR
jgi:predicted ATPase/DNA-binding winged helix-turn-helix (wHTH) protein